MSAQVVPDGPQGIVAPVAGDPDDMRPRLIEGGQEVAEGTALVTAGWSDGRDLSAYPSRVSRSGRSPRPPSASRSFSGSGSALRRHGELEFVQVMTGGPERPGVQRMIVTWQIGLRLAAIVLVTVLAPGLVPVLPLVPRRHAGRRAGGDHGAGASRRRPDRGGPGFATGLLLDSVLLQTLGVSSLVLLSVGYLAGRYRESSRSTARSSPALLAAASPCSPRRLPRTTADAGRRGRGEPARRPRGPRQVAARVPLHLPPVSADPPRPALRAGPRGPRPAGGSSAAAASGRTRSRRLRPRRPPPRGAA